MTSMLKLREKATVLGIEHIRELDRIALVHMGEIRKMARHLGVEGAGHLNKEELIRAIQIREDHQPCFGSQWCNPCQREGCPWKVDCGAQPFGN